MSGNIKLRWFVLPSLLAALFLIAIPPVVSWAGALEDAQERVRQNPNDAIAHNNLGHAYNRLGRYQDAISSYKEAIRLRPNYAIAHHNLGKTYESSGKYQDAISSYKEAIRIRPGYAIAYVNLGVAYIDLGRHQDALISFKKAVRIKPDFAEAYINLGYTYINMDRHQEAISSLKEAIRIRPDFTEAYNGLGYTYNELGQHQDALTYYRKAARIKPDFAEAHNGLGYTYRELGRYRDAISSYKEAIRIKPDYVVARNNLNELEKKLADERPALGKQLSEKESTHEALQNIQETDRLARERQRFEEERKKFEAFRLVEEKRLEEERKKHEALRLAEEERQRQAQAKKESSLQSGTGSGFFVSKMGHVITNAHVVQSCNRVTIGDNANKQVPAELINTDRSNDLALLKLSTLEMASAESKSLIQKLGVVVVPLAANGLLRNEDVRLGEKVLVAGYPFGDVFSNTIKVTSGIVSATRGAGDDSGQFQLDAAVQPGNSGGPIYDSGGNIVGVVISQLNKRTFGSLVENVNFGVKASTVRQFLVSSGLSSKKSERTEEKSTEQLAEIAQNQALMVMCLQ